LVWAFQLGHPAHWTDRGWEDRALAALADLDDVDRARMSRDDRGNAAWLRHDIAWNRGDIADARAQRMLMDDLVDNGPSAALRYINLVNRSCGAFLEGRLAEAAEWNQRQLDYGNETGRPDALNYFIMLDGSVSRDQGRPEVMIETVLTALPTLPASVASFAGAHLVTWLTDAGRAEQAREIVAHERASGFLPARLPTSLKTTYAYGLSEAVMYLRDREAAAELFEIMLPWSGRMFFDSIQAYGAVDRSLGRLATLLGRFDEAESSLAAAAAFHERIGAPLFLARTWADQAELLLARDATAGLAPASSLVERAVAVARDLGAPGVERYTSSVIARRDA
jgi:hypothetical protein